MKLIFYNKIGNDVGLFWLEKNELDSTYGISDEELTERFKASIKLDKEYVKLKVSLLLVMMMKINMLTCNILMEGEFMSQKYNS